MDEDVISSLVQHYSSQREEKFETLAQNLLKELLSGSTLKPLIHSGKYRTKDPEHLRDKLRRKWKDAIAKNEPFEITTDNLFERVTDLAGIRLIHLHTSQFPKIHAAICQVLDDLNYSIAEGPKAHTWDDEYKDMFTGWGAQLVARPTMYTSVHYIVDPKRKTKSRCELQVRTLMEEVWGEVSHTVNYPHETSNKIVQEQLKVLARFTSGCTRLVDTIFHKPSEEPHPGT